MAIVEQKTIVAYRCPHCGGAVLGLCGKFALSGGRMLKLKCPCGESSMTATETNDGKIRLSVPCLMCNTDHNYVVSPNVFYGRDLFLLNCAYTNLDVCFSGEESKVREALQKNESELKKLFANAGISSLSQLHGDKPAGEELLPDAQVFDIVRFLVRELEADGQIDCPCYNGEYEVEFTERGIRVYCQNCGGEKIFPANSLSAAQEFLSCDHLTLSEPDADATEE